MASAEGARIAAPIRSISKVLYRPQAQNHHMARRPASRGDTRARQDTSAIALEGLGGER
jgi:hypothetical protein